MKRNRKYHIITFLLLTLLIISLFFGKEIIENKIVTISYILILAYYYYKFIDVAILLNESDYQNRTILLFLLLFGIYTYWFVKVGINYINHSNLLFSIYFLTLNLIYIISNQLLFKENE